MKFQFYFSVNNLHTYDSLTELINGDVFFEIIEPEELEFTYRIRPAKDFGATFKKEFFMRKRNLLVPTEPIHACDSIQNQLQIMGNVAFIARGDCSFLKKTVNAENAGAIAVIVTDLETSTDEEIYIEMIHDNSTHDTNIPAGYLLGRNGRVILQTLNKLDLNNAVINIPLNLTLTPHELINHPPWAMT